MLETFALNTTLLDSPAPTVPDSAVPDTAVPDTTLPSLPRRVENYTICCPKYVTVEELIAEADSVAVARLS
jgi:hypothetical protein